MSAEAFDWDGMGGNIGGLSVYVLALDIIYSALVESQWIESELPVTRKKFISIHFLTPA